MNALPPVPDQVLARIDQIQYELEGGFPVEQGYIWTSCASVENGNPLFWDGEVAAELTDGPVAPPTMLSVWFRPHHWSPGLTEPAVPLQAHFDLKEDLGATGGHHLVEHQRLPPAGTGRRPGAIPTGPPVDQ